MSYRVSQSKVKTYRKCRHAYHLKYVEELRRKRKSRPLAFGSLIHKCLELEIEGQDAFEYLAEQETEINQSRMFEQEKVELQEVVNTVNLILEEYLEFWADHSSLEFLEIDGKKAEHQFEIEILPGIIWNGKIDALGEEDGLLWLVEHKSFNRRPSADDRWRNLQSATYFRAIDILGWRSADGTCWDYIWSKAPAEPGLLQNGQLSSKSIDTLPPTVSLAIRRHGLKRRDYRDLLKKVEDNRSKWFYRVRTPVLRSVTDELFSDFLDTVEEMEANHGKKQDRNIDRHCSWCDFEPLCRAKLEGTDHEYVKEREYAKNTYQSGQEGGVHSVDFEDIETDD